MPASNTVLSMDKNEIRAYVRQKIKAKYRTLKRCAHAHGFTASAVYGALRNGRLPKWMQDEFGVKREVVYRVKA